MIFNFISHQTQNRMWKCGYGLSGFYPNGQCTISTPNAVFSCFFFFTKGAQPEITHKQSHKKQKLSGQQDFCCKNFPDKARKSRQFSNSRQMRIKGGFARFWIIQLHFLDDLDTFQIIRKLSRSSGNFPDHTDTVLDHPNSLQIIRTHF